MPFSGVAVAYTAAGGIILYSGYKGATISDTLKAVLAGNLKVTDTEPISGAVNSGNASGTAVTSASVAEQDWIKSVLSGIGAPATQANITSLENWIAHEGPYGTQGGNNPLNTELPIPGSTSFNGLAVQNYPTAAEGISVTVETLLSGAYGDILMLLRSGQGLCGHSLSGLSTWSGGGYSSVC